MSQKFDVVIVGGGIVGCSLAYHLAAHQQRSVVLLERAKLTSGTTWHAAGLVAELRASANLTRLAKYSGELYESIQAQGEPCGYNRVGALTVSNNPDRTFELNKQAAMAQAVGVSCQWMTPDAISERWSHIDTSRLQGGLYMPNDGQTNPVDTTLALARLARQQGAQIQEDCAVRQIIRDARRVCGVETDQETYTADQVVICAGLWSRELGQQVGVDIPLYPVEHYYAVTESVSFDAQPPILRIPDCGIYVKPDAGRALIGSFETQARPIDPASLPDDFHFGELPFNLEHFTPYLAHALDYVPQLNDVGIRTWFNGPESFTPDGRYILGESPQLADLFVAAGFNSIGIQSAGGVGQAMAQWLTQQHPPMDLWEVDIRRFKPLHNQTEYLQTRTAESLGLLYAMHWPYQQYESARGQLLSPVHRQLADQGACFGELAGWERANWYARPGQTPQYEYSYGAQNWFDNARQEHHAARNGLALFDQTSFAKYLVSGPDAAAFLTYLSTANLDVDIDQVVYCQWLNPRGGIEADVTITRLSDTSYWVISAAASTTRDLHWMHQHLQSYKVQIRDITQQYAVFGLMGPQARTALSGLVEEDLSDEQFPFATARTINIGEQPVRATRITYVGSLGWELYVPWSAASQVYTALQTLAPTPAGYHAMDSLRIEKAYRHWGHDLTDEDTPVEAGLSFTVDWSTDFVGKQALTQQKKQGVGKRLVLLEVCDDTALLVHDEPVLQHNKIVGKVTSSAYSYQFNRSLAFAYIHSNTPLKRADLLNAQYEVQIGSNRFAAKPHLRAPHDPDNLEIRC